MPRNQELETQLREVARDFDRAFPARPQLGRMIMRQVEREPQRGRRVGRRLVAELALTGLLLVGGAALAIAMAQAHSVPAARSQPAASAKPSAPSRASLPEEDLRAAGLTKVAALITPEDLQVQSGGHTVSLIGAYADPSRIVLFFRADQVTMDMLTSSNDLLVDYGQGFVMSSGGGRSGVAGDLVLYRDGRPHVAADGLAHLSIALFASVPSPQSPPPRIQWNFVIALPVQTATAVTPAP